MSAAEYLHSLFGLEGKIALVTGGGAGLGLIATTALAQAGAKVVICSRKLQVCQAAAAAINDTIGRNAVTALEGDVADEAGVVALAGAVRRFTDKLDILVNNAGTTWGAPFEEFPWQGWERVMAVNVYGSFTLTREMMPLLKRAASDTDPSRVINMGSVMGTVPFADDGYSYVASKAAVHHLTQVLARKFVREHVNVNALAPGLFHTRMTAFATSQDPDVGHESVPMTRLGNPDDLAAALLLLCGRGGAYISGAIVPVDGGMAIDPPHRMYSAT
ncbi:MAG: SDR family NAD(P)-dependent oxidoreductase [Betaproteobacteria bacterium]